jgi:hypothetical protein
MNGQHPQATGVLKTGSVKVSTTAADAADSRNG